jgi:hypothetical protein
MKPLVSDAAQLFQPALLDVGEEHCAPIGVLDRCFELFRRQ